MAVEIRNVRYNPVNSAFEGRIDIHRDGTSFRYPCSVSGPMNMAPGEVRRRMQSQAERMSDTPQAMFSYR